MEKFKIEYAEVKLTPEQLKVVEDKIESLESLLMQAVESLKIYRLFVDKLFGLVQLQDSEMNIPFSGDDYDMYISSSMTGSKVCLRFGKK